MVRRPIFYFGGLIAFKDENGGGAYYPLTNTTYKYEYKLESERFENNNHDIVSYSSLRLRLILTVIIMTDSEITQIQKMVENMSFDGNIELYLATGIDENIETPGQKYETIPNNQDKILFKLVSSNVAPDSFTEKLRVGQTLKFEFDAVEKN